MPHPRWRASPHSHHRCRQLSAMKHLHSQRTPQKNHASSQGDTRKHNQRRLLCSHPQFCVLRSTGGSRLWARTESCHIRAGCGTLWALIGTRQNELSSYDLSRNFVARAPWRHFSLKHEERVHLFVITGRLPHNEPISFQNSTIYYSVAIIYSDRITVENMTSLFSSFHFWWLSIWLLSYRRSRWVLESDCCKLHARSGFLLFVLYQQMNKCGNQQFIAP